MSKLSLSRSRGQPVGPLTSTQVPRERQPPVEGLSREELLFQRQLEAALKKSRYAELLALKVQHVRQFLELSIFVGT